MDELVLILPIGDLTFVIVKIIGIIVEVSKRLAVIKDDALTAIDFWRTVIANNIENDFDPSRMTGVDQTFQRGDSTSRVDSPALINRGLRRLKSRVQ